MSTMNFIGIIERYHEHRNAIQDLLASIITGIAEEPIYHDKKTQCKAMKCLTSNYPFVDLLYVLDKVGIQISDNVAVSSKSQLAYLGKGFGNVKVFGEWLPALIIAYRAEMGNHRPAYPAFSKPNVTISPSNLSSAPAQSFGGVPAEHSRVRVSLMIYSCQVAIASANVGLAW